jgi:hypothetical protein
MTNLPCSGRKSLISFVSLTIAYEEVVTLKMRRRRISTGPSSELPEDEEDKGAKVDVDTARFLWKQAANDDFSSLGHGNASILGPFIVSNIDEASLLRPRLNGRRRRLCYRCILSPINSESGMAVLHVAGRLCSVDDVAV